MNKNIFQSANGIYFQCAMILFLFLGVYYKTLAELIHVWLDSSNNSHGILVPFISLYLIWQKLAKLKEIELSGYKYGLIIIVLSLFIYVFGIVADVGFLRRLTIIGVIIGIVLFNGGINLFKEIAFPLLFLLFMVPVPDSLILTVSFPLQLFATKVSHSIIQFLSIPAFREGNMIYFVTTQLEVAEACSGIRSIVAYSMLSLLFAYLLKSNKKRIIIVLLALPLAIIVNIIRVTGTGILAHFYGGDVARGFLHEFSGIAVFIVGFVMMVTIFGIFTRQEKNAGL